MMHSTAVEDKARVSDLSAIETDCCSDEELDVDPSGQQEDAAPSPAVEIAFSASAGVFVYQMGVAAFIQDMFDLSNCCFSGCSGGSWAAALLASETPVREAWRVIKETQAKIITAPRWYSGYGRYATIVEQTLHELWREDKDIHKRVEQRRLTIAVTKFPSMKAEKLTSWESLDDLTRSIMASSLVPRRLRRVLDMGRPVLPHGADDSGLHALGLDGGRRVPHPRGLGQERRQQGVQLDADANESARDYRPVIDDDLLLRRADEAAHHQAVELALAVGHGVPLVGGFGHARGALRHGVRGRQAALSRIGSRASAQERARRVLNCCADINARIVHLHEKRSYLLRCNKVCDLHSSTATASSFTALAMCLLIGESPVPDKVLSTVYSAALHAFPGFAGESHPLVNFTSSDDTPIACVEQFFSESLARAWCSTRRCLTSEVAFLLQSFVDKVDRQQDKLNVGSVKYSRREPSRRDVGAVVTALLPSGVLSCPDDKMCPLSWSCQAR
ncbi:hypothetical protein ON010_g935 [Phytophthora cinnamomi]|nr:hypothetical protein ON010_g935 [Phytophthora cinnamomi]